MRRPEASTMLSTLEPSVHESVLHALNRGRVIAIKEHVAPCDISIVVVPNYQVVNGQLYGHATSHISAIACALLIQTNVSSRSLGYLPRQSSSSYGAGLSRLSSAIA